MIHIFGAHTNHVLLKYFIFFYLNMYWGFLSFLFQLFFYHMLHKTCRFYKNKEKHSFCIRFAYIRRGTERGRWREEGSEGEVDFIICEEVKFTLVGVQIWFSSNPSCVGSQFGLELPHQVTHNCLLHELLGIQCLRLL